MLLTNGFFGSGDAILQVANETASLPAWPGPGSPSVAAPVLPAAFTRPRFVQSLDEDDDNGASEVYGLGSHRPQTIIPGGRKYRHGVAWGVLSSQTLDPFLAQCKPSALETLPWVCLLTGAKSGTGGTAQGVVKAQRFAKCDSLEVTLSANNPVTARAFFWFSAEEPQGDLPSGTVTSPFAPSLTVTPFDWNDVQEIRVQGVNVRHLVDRVTLNADYDLERKMPFPDFGNHPWSRAASHLQEGQFRFRATLQFQTPDPQAYIAANGESNTPRPLEIILQKKERPTEQLVFWSRGLLRATTGKGVTTVSPHVSRLTLSLIDLNFAPP